MQDMVKKGRHAYQTLVGDKHPASVLAEPDVVAIRLAKSRGVSYTDLAAQYQVHRTTIRLIVIGETWSHLEVLENVRCLHPLSKAAKEKANATC